MLTIYIGVCGLPVSAGLLLCLCGFSTAGIALIVGGYALMALGVWCAWRR